jgi:hypothetical protein
VQIQFLLFAQQVCLSEQIHQLALAEREVSEFADDSLAQNTAQVLVVDFNVALLQVEVGPVLDGLDQGHLAALSQEILLDQKAERVLGNGQKFFLLQ